MSRSNDEIIIEIKEILEERINPAVAEHGGSVDFLSFENGTLRLQMSGACSGCAGSTSTIRFGVENMMTYFVPEVKEIISVDEVDPGVSPYYSKEEN
jgi:Fe-S cluster biogenesis protein NfuA